ncbi:DUF6049 family protein [Streptomyces sp. NBRC 110028]|uniref:DUF6049 family protein n=1 Tax=Streptomyces sp. NBRC 110028 TaxID=1621260 RepID=UPI000B2F8060|nr:DUF6049 family protein [Streptomyces sp. NBRC 110028]
MTAGARAYGWTIAVAVALLLPGGPATAAPAAFADAPATPARASHPYPLTVELRSLSPTVVRHDGDLRISGTVKNTSGHRVTGAHIGVRIGAAGSADTRGALADHAARTTLTRADGAEVAAHTARLARLGAHAGRRFELTVPVSGLGLDGAGAYPLTVTATAADGRVLGLTRGYLPAYPDGTGLERLRTTVLWPLTDVPHMEALTRRTGDGSVLPVFRDDALTAAFGPGGRLRRLVELGEDEPVTWAVDPDLIVQAQAMTRGYRVARTPGSSDPQEAGPGGGGKAAAGWLAALRKAVRGRDVIALPYADPDLASLARAGDPALAALLRRASATGTAVVNRALGVRARAGVAWPAGGMLDAGTAGYARRLGLDTMLASGEGPDPYGAALVAGGATDDGAVALDDGGTALTYDATLASLLFRSHPAGGAAGAPARLALRQRLLAETLTAVRELPYAARDLVLVPPRRMPVGVGRALLSALAAGQEAGWLEPSRFGDGLRAPEAGELRDGGRPAGLRATELPPERLAAVARDRRRLRALAMVLSDAQATVASVRAALARSVSTGWRGDAAGARAYQEGVARYLTASIASVRLVPKSRVVVTGGSATIPVTVANGLQQDLTGVELRVFSSRPERARAVDRAVDVTASRAVSRTVRVRVSAHANGPVRLTAQLYTRADGRPWGAPMAFTAEVRSVPSGAVAFVAGGVGLMVLAATLRLRSARRRGARR